MGTQPGPSSGQSLHLINTSPQKQLLDLLNTARMKNTTGLEFAEVSVLDSDLDDIYQKMEQLINQILP